MSETVMSGVQRVRGWCALCKSRCGCVSVVEDGRLTAVEPDPDHPTGRALCAKGQAAPELVYSPDRVLSPMKRTRPKGEADPGWTEISWDEALDLVAAGMQRLAKAHGPRSVAFAVTTPSGTSMSDSIQWVERLMRAYGSPNNCYGTEICNWHKDVAPRYTFGTDIGTPDLEHTGCVVLWGHNPGASWLAQGQRVAAARARGASLIVIDPRRAGPAGKADQWLRPRPGTDGALALGLAGVMLEEGWYDRDFVTNWTNGHCLVRDDENRLLTASDLGADRGDGQYIAWDKAAAAPAMLNGTPTDATQRGDWLREGHVTVDTLDGPVTCRPVFDRYKQLCGEFTPERVERITGIAPAQLRDTAKRLWRSRPVSFYAWSGVGQHTNATQTARAITLLYALTGNIGQRGGNVHLDKVATNDVSGLSLVTPNTRAQTLGLEARPLGPPKDGWCTSDDLYRAILEARPYPVKGLLSFGSNLLVSHAGVRRAAEALERLEFHVHADLFVNPTAAYADVFLPVSSAWEREALRVGFEVSQAANGHVQLRPPAVAPRGESRDDGWIAFELAQRLGLGDVFWDGDRDAGLREWLAPSGIALDELRARPEGIRVELQTHYQAYRAKGFDTPSGLVEIWSETFRTHGQDPLPSFVEPAISPNSRPDLVGRYPLVLTSAKAHQFCHSQHRNLPRLRKLQRNPTLDIHPDAAGERGIENNDWVTVETPSGKIRAQAKLKVSLAPGVVVAQHGWWQACEALGLPGYPVTGDGTANFNTLIDDGEADPISGSTAHRSYLCEVRLYR